MRTETSSNAVSNSPRVRDAWHVLRRWAGGRSGATRRAAPAIGLAIVALAAVSYFCAPSEPAAVEWLFGGQKFAPDKIETIVAALADADIRAVVDSRRVGVARDRLRAARAALKQAKIAPPSLDEILNPIAEGSSIFDTPEQLQTRDDRAREQALAALIERQCAGVVSAHVKITPLAAPNGFNFNSARAALKAKAVVTLETENDRPISNRSVRKILSLLRGFTRFEIAAESVGLLDGRRQYLDAGNHALLRSALNGAHEEDLAETVRAGLASADAEIGVRFEAEPESPIEEDSNPRAFVNRPADVADAKPETTRGVTDLGAHDPGKAFVSVRLNRRVDSDRDATPNSASTRETSAWTLTDEEIKVRVTRALPKAEFGDVSIERVDEPIHVHPLSQEVATEPKARSWSKPEWLPYAIAGGALGLVALAAGGSLLMSWRRRPALRAAEPAGARTRFDREDASTARPAPSERVRELVRRDPEAAAGVLQRWIGQGGHVE